MNYINGVNKGDLNVDSNFFFGKGVFETIMVKNKPLLLDEHIERLNKSCIELNINRRLSSNEVINFINKNKLFNCALKITVSDENIVYSTRAIPYAEDDYKQGFKIGLSKVLRNSTSILSFIKSTCYIENLIEKNKAESIGNNEMLFLNEKSMVTEGCTCNIFFVKNNKVFTPKVSCGLLNGIVRQWIIKRFHVEEGEYTLDDIMKCDDAFVTNSLFGIMPVKILCGRIMNKTTIQIMIDKKYRSEVLEE